MNRTINRWVKKYKNLQSSIYVNPNGIVIELDRKIELNNQEIEERIRNLDNIKANLIDVADAINQISSDSKRKKQELDEIVRQYQEIEQDKVESEKLLEVNKDSFSRIMYAANKKVERKSIIKGLIIGMITGFLSSLLVWFLPK